MVNAVMILVILAAAVVGIVWSVGHFRGKGGCCGGGGYKARKKKLRGVLYTKRFSVDGMHCANCKARVEEVVNDIRGAAGRVDLKKQELTVSYAERIDDELIISRLARAGYAAVVMEDK